MTMHRRALLRGAVSAPIAAALPVLAAAPAAAQSGEFRSTVDVLAYALNLKYVQAEFYRQGNAAGLLSGLEADYLSQIGYHKQQHVAALTNAINEEGGMPPAAPSLDFGDSFADRQTYLDAAWNMERTVVRAYVGMPAAPTFGGEVFRDMSGISSVDARAAAVLGTIAGKPVGDGIYFENGLVPPMAATEVLETLRPFVTGPWAMAAGAAITD
jgi:ferritin-like protein